MNQKIKLLITLFMALLYVVSIVLMETYADPVGTTVTNISTISSVSSPENRTDNGGTINTLTVDVVQQNFNWKAYVGNISATLTLNDGDSNTIYDWSVNALTISGELYASRNSSITWTSITCANGTTIETEQALVNMTASQGDNINKTFNFTKHPTYTIAGTVISNSTCASLFTYYNTSSQQDNESSKYSEILLQNVDGTLVYVTQLEQDETAFSGGNTTYDFQLVIPDDKRNGQITTYWFYAEIDS